jgi:hypothetical protein
MRLNFQRSTICRGIAALAGAGLCALAGLGAPQAQASPAASSPYNWHIAKVFAGQPYSNLIPMTAISANDAWLFGDGASNREVALHYNGTTWTPSYPFGTLPRPWYVSATGSRNIWVTGQNCTSTGLNYVSRYNGSKWATTTFKTASQADGGGFCQAPVVTTGATSGWIFSKSYAATRAMHFTGGKWVPVTIGDFGSVMYVSAVSASDIWLLTATFTTPARMLVVHYDGRKWTSLRLPGAPVPRGEVPYATGIEAVSSANIWISAQLITSNGEVSSSTLSSLVLHWTPTSGFQWVKVPFGDIAWDISYDAGSVWTGAQTTTGTGVGWAFLKWNGKQWARQPLPTQGINGNSISFQLYNVVHIPGTHSFWAEGDASYFSPSNQQEAAAVVFKYGP